MPANPAVPGDEGPDTANRFPPSTVRRNASGSPARCRAHAAVPIEEFAESACREFPGGARSGSGTVREVAEAARRHSTTLLVDCLRPPETGRVEAGVPALQRMVS